MGLLGQRDDLRDASVDKDVLELERVSEVEDKEEEEWCDRESSHCLRFMAIEAQLKFVGSMLANYCSPVLWLIFAS